MNGREVRTLAAFYWRHLWREGYAVPLLLAPVALAVARIVAGRIFAVKEMDALGAGVTTVAILLCAWAFSTEVHKNEIFTRNLPMSRGHVFMARVRAAMLPVLGAAVLSFAMLVPYLQDTPFPRALTVFINAIAAIAAVQGGAFLFASVRDRTLLMWLIAIPIAIVLLPGAAGYVYIMVVYDSLLPAVLSALAAGGLFWIAYRLYTRVEPIRGSLVAREPEKRAAFITEYPSAFMLPARLLMRGITRSPLLLAFLISGLAMVLLFAGSGTGQTRRDVWFAVLYIVVFYIMLTSAGFLEIAPLVATTRYSMRRLFATWCAPVQVLLALFIAVGSIFAPYGGLLGYLEGRGATACTVLRSFFFGLNEPYKSDYSDPPEKTASQVRRYLADFYRVRASEQEILALCPPLPPTKVFTIDETSISLEPTFLDERDRYERWMKAVDERYGDEMQAGIRRITFVKYCSWALLIQLALATTLFGASFWPRLGKVGRRVLGALGIGVSIGLLALLMFGFGSHNGFFVVPMNRLAAGLMEEWVLFVPGLAAVFVLLYFAAERMFRRVEWFTK